MEGERPRPWGYMLLCAAVCLSVGILLGKFGLAAPRGTPITIATAAPSEMALPAATSAPLRVYVSGAVHQPAVYELAPDSIVADALTAAGGAAPDADLDQINLALEVQDQQHVYVPRQGETMAVPAGSRMGEVVGLININTATAADLEQLPRIGPVMAQQIVDYREANGPFTRIEDIQDVPNVGPATFEAIREQICVD